MTPRQQHRVALIGGARNGEIITFDERPPITISLVVYQSGSDISDVLTESWLWVSYRRLAIPTHGSCSYTYVSQDIYEEYMRNLGVLNRYGGNAALSEPASMKGDMEYPWDAIRKETDILSRIDEVIDDG